MGTDCPEPADFRYELAELLLRQARLSDPRSSEDFRHLLIGAAALRSEANSLFDATVASARMAGNTWQTIGDTLGMTRQAAQKRFAPPAGPSASDLDPQERLIGPTTHFDEVGELALAGRYGWHSVEAGANYHRVVRSDVQWEHSRVTLSRGKVRRLVADGWEVVGSTFPYTYLKRATDLPALTEP